jgi:2-polyprenyl-3-methyl-5-hydroxy-6-metoxy-1,4-benzoquinol methylase
MNICVICGTENQSPSEEASVRSNVRKFRDELFHVWRCAQCNSIHARDEVDLAHYYAGYPFHHMADKPIDWMLAAMYKSQLKRLQDAGLKREHSLLDYGCGGGTFVRYLQSQGFARATGFDEYSERFADRSTLSQTYDFVFTQDVLEHVPDPNVFLREVNGLVSEGGCVAFGTPSADAIDLHDAAQSLHALHQPYHRHIFSKQALIGIADRMGWELVRYYPKMYINTPLPFVNQAFLMHYLHCNGDDVDAAMEPIRANNIKLYTPVTLMHAFFGSLYAPETDVMAIFRKPPQ